MGFDIFTTVNFLFPENLPVPIKQVIPVYNQIKQHYIAEYCTKITSVSTLHIQKTLSGISVKIPFLIILLTTNIHNAQLRLIHYIILQPIETSDSYSDGMFFLQARGDNELLFKSSSSLGDIFLVLVKSTLKSSLLI